MKRLIAKVSASPEHAKQLLISGNKRFVEGKPTKKDFGLQTRKDLVQNGQNPFAIIVSCSDSRVPPEIIFDVGLGDLFVIRVAGNVIDDDILGSIEFAVEEMDVPLVVVLGHTKCGAVGEALKEKEEDDDIEVLMDKIQPSVDRFKGRIDDRDMLYEHVVDGNIEHSVGIISERPLLKEFIDDRKLVVVGAKYDLETGIVEFVQ